MKKFHELYKEKVTKAEELQESKVISDLRSVYTLMLEQYSITALNDLDEETQLSFLTELSHYWNDVEGISEKGEKFVAKRSLVLNENSTAQQKKNFLKNKVQVVINETVRQSDLKWKLYDVIDEMYNQLNASSLRDILTPDMIKGIIYETFSKTVEEFTENIHKEISDSTPKKYVVKVKSK